MTVPATLKIKLFRDAGRSSLMLICSVMVRSGVRTAGSIRECDVVKLETEAGREDKDSVALADSVWDAEGDPSNEYSATF